MKNKGFAALLREARRSRGLSQDDLCMLIGAGDKSNISRWENGVAIPSEAMVKRMVDAYDDPLLGYIYLQECSELGRMLLPQIVQADLDNLTLRFQKEYGDIPDVQRDMIAIACDGVIEPHEQDRWSRVEQEVTELAGISLSIVINSFRQSKKPLQGGNLERACVF